MHRWSDALIGTVLVVLVAVGALRWADTTVEFGIAAQSLGPFVVIGLGLLAAATLALRRWWMLVPVVAATTVAMSLALPSFFASTVAGPKDLTVMSANLGAGRAHADQVMAAVRAHDVDVLVLTEATPAVIDRLEDAGLTSWLPELTGAARAQAGTGTMIFSRLRMTVVSGTDDPTIEQTPNLQPEVVLDVAGRQIRLKAAHPLAPVGGAADRWRAGLAALGRWEDGLASDEAVVLAGDLNASAGNPGFRALTAGLVDAQRAAGLGWVRTWPVVGHRMPPFVALDHLLSRGLAVVDAGQVAFHGSDHALVWASYRLRR